MLRCTSVVQLGFDQTRWLRYIQVSNQLAKISYKLHKCYMNIHMRRGNVQAYYAFGAFL